MISISPLETPLLGPLSSRIKTKTKPTNNKNLPGFQKLKQNKVHKAYSYYIYDSHFNKMVKNVDWNQLCHIPLTVHLKSYPLSLRFLVHNGKNNIYFIYLLRYKQLNVGRLAYSKCHMSVSCCEYYHCCNVLSLKQWMASVFFKFTLIYEAISLVQETQITVCLGNTPQLSTLS